MRFTHNGMGWETKKSVGRNFFEQNFRIFRLQCLFPAKILDDLISVISSIGGTYFALNAITIG